MCSNEAIVESMDTDAINATEMERVEMPNLRTDPHILSIEATSPGALQLEESIAIDRDAGLKESSPEMRLTET